MFSLTIAHPKSYPRQTSIIILLAAALAWSISSLVQSAFQWDLQSSNTTIYAIHTFTAMYLLFLSTFSLRQTSVPAYEETTTHLGFLSFVAALLSLLVTILPSHAPPCPVPNSVGDSTGLILRLSGSIYGIVFIMVVTTPPM
jgi:hypothetical protein